ncbi:MAK11 [Sanghuangporus sanghuang]
MAHANKEQEPHKKVKSTALPLKSALKKPKAPPAVCDKISVKSSSGANPKNSDLVNKNSSKKPKPSQRAPTLPPVKMKSRVDKGKGKAAPEPSPKIYPSTFKVVAGTYEKLLYGLEGSFIGEDGTTLDGPTLKPIFIFPAHVACVKAVAASPEGGKWLATGSADEIIKVWDLRRRKEVGDVVHHEGSITYLDFPTRTHLVSASEDGTICIFRSRDWILLRSMKGHKGRVNCVAVHPSGKVGLSVGKDRTLRMWDLMRGKGSASTKLGKEGEIVRWSSDGSRFVVQTDSCLDIYSTEMSLLHTVRHSKRIQDVRFHRAKSGEEYLLVASEDRKVTIYSTKSEDNTSLPIIAEAVGHQNRVKSLDTLAVATTQAKSEQKWTTIMSTVSSDGWIRVFDLGTLDSLGSTTASKDAIQLEAIASYDTKGSRLTCCTLADGETPIQSITGKRKHEDDDESDVNTEDRGDVPEEDEGTNGVADGDEWEDE